MELLPIPGASEPEPGRAAAVIQEHGLEEVYLSYLLALQNLCSQRGKSLLCWGDFLLDHPALLARLPPDAVVVARGGGKGYEECCSVLADHAVPFYVAPAAASWCVGEGRNESAMDAIQAPTA